MTSFHSDPGACGLLRGPRDALLIVDVQRDFLAGGALAVPDGGTVIPALNRYIARAVEAGARVFAPLLVRDSEVVS